jgi:hypothetical protein
MAARQPRVSSLPPSLPPIAVDRVKAAEMVGVSTSKFEQMVADGRMPKPRIIDARRLWGVEEVRTAFYALPILGEDDEPNEWDEVAA